MDFFKLINFKLPRLLQTNNFVVSVTRKYAFKSDLKIKWVRPEKIPFYNPAKTGDLETIPEIDKNQPQLRFRNCKELENASDTVKKLCSLEFAPRNQLTKTYFRETVEKVKRHNMDVASIEVKIAKWTGYIRSLQEVMERYPRNKRFKVNLKELIDKRKKHIKYLRRWDYKRFEWLLENLNIVYKPLPDVIHRVTRKESLRKLTNKYCEELREERLAAYKAQLQAEQPAFLEEKIRNLQFIRDEEQACGAEVTITQEEIDNVKEQLQDLLDQKKTP